MKHISTKTITAVAIIATLAISGAVVAETRNSDEGGFFKHRMFGHGKGMRKQMKERFAKADTDGSGSLNRDEFNTTASKRFQKLDANGDGNVTDAEINAMVDARLSKMRARMKTRILGNLDANKDGSVTKEEFEAQQTERFASLDGNSDGEIAPREMRHAMKKRYKEMRSEWKKRRHGSSENQE